MKFYKHQKEALKKAKGMENFAFFMDMGTGKTLTSIADSTLSNLDLILVFSPKGVHLNWPKEFEKFGYNHVEARAWQSKWTKKKRAAFFEPSVKPLLVLSFNVDAIKINFVEEHLYENIRGRAVALIIDESTRIKNAQAQRTKKLIKLGKHASVRRILSGTPTANSPFDLFAQFLFLDWRILGYYTWTAFKARYAVQKDIEVVKGPKYLECDCPEWTEEANYNFPECPFCGADLNNYNTRKIKTVVGYKNLPELIAKIRPYCFMISKEDCLDLPDRVYVSYTAQMEGEQLRVYQQQRDQLLSEHQGKIMTIKIMLSQLLRLRQICSGFFVSDDGALMPFKTNAKLELLGEILEDLEGKKIIIWACFRYDINLINKTFGDKFKIGVYDGRTNDMDRASIENDFQSDDLDIFLGNPSAGGMGLNLTAAEYVIDYSIDFDNEKRKQAHDRAYRIGQTKKVTYIDLSIADSVEQKVKRILSGKQQTDQLVMSELV